MGKTACLPVCPYESSPSPDLLLSSLFNDAQNGITDFQTRVAELHAQSDALRRSVEALKEDCKNEEKGRMYSYTKDLLTKLIGRIYEKRGVTLPTIFTNEDDDIDVASCYIQAAESITEAEFTSVTELPLEYFALLKRYPQSVKVGHKVGFETGGQICGTVNEGVVEGWGKLSEMGAAAGVLS
ncbi:hypothetical protein MMC30_004639 [Trapelia coarctata]|nr:hypothetical protein [Trapelia coarctata]